ncbi:MAG TPA: DUF2905 domain-containing protein [Thermodesulfobacteriaceae bacterium]|nr:DUF2905 domain-containing protein [Thermodesulfobacteriaceae bacterium]
MNPLHEFGKAVFFIGIVMAVTGLLMTIAPKIPFIGKLPGDIVIRKGDFTFYFPIVTCLVLSVILTLLFALFRK